METIYLLDTNVVSELMRPQPATEVLAWIDAQGTGALAFSSVGCWEIRYGLACMTEGRRRKDLERRFDALVRALFGAGIYDFTQAAAVCCANLMRAKRDLGECLDAHLPDAMIAGIAAAEGLCVATRNAAEFDHCGVEWIDPWRADSSRL